MKETNKLDIEDTEKREYNMSRDNHVWVHGHFRRNSNNFRNMKSPDALGKIKGSCGDTMKITISIENEIIKDACFWTDGCGAGIACGNMLTNMLKGKTIEEASAITSTKLLENLDGLPKEHKHCATLAVSILREAIKNYHKD